MGEEFGSGLDIYIRALVFSWSHLSTLVRLSFFFRLPFSFELLGERTARAN